MTLFPRIIVSALIALAIAVLYSSLNHPEGAFHFNPSLALAVVAAAVIACLLPVSSSLASGGSSGSASHGKQSEQGKVKWFNYSKGFGFITRDNGDDIFVHYRSIIGEGRRSLHEGQRVAFNVVESDKGLQAEDVEVIKSDTE